MDSVSFLDLIQSQFKKKHPFVAYRLPHSSSTKLLLQQEDTIFYAGDYKESGFIFAPFDTKNKSILIPTAKSESYEAILEDFSVDEKDSVYDFESKEGKDSHIRLVNSGINAIQKGFFEKVVLSRCETIAYSNNQPAAIFKQLLVHYKSALVYLWYHPKVGLWLGASPEILLKVENRRFETVSLAGTQPYNGTLDVSWKTKELVEQDIVTNAIRHALGENVAHFHFSDLETVRAGNLLHLQTKITGVLSSDLKIILDKLHPTPAVCGLPKDSAKAFILKNENYNREFYTGFLGELNMKRNQTRNINKRNVENNAYSTVKNVCNLFVNLRCMQLKKDQALIYVGGGITEDSNSEFEWMETVSKTQTIKRVLLL
ncbi:chorismate-binding protein [uncultured Psychroserpens sp.]|uniref:chorismate-binding protein n=1 Tax=uncultured Psychroserpens sp. TaxID=255436 RepID=UPI00262BD4EE|nr:chorismate-binding protein [uncultured Psychroserpens sp.]